MKNIKEEGMKEYIESLVLNMIDNCRSCGKPPFCDKAPKENCEEWIKVKRQHKKLVDKKGLIYKFENVEE